jgi:hypothetical protein
MRNDAIGFFWDDTPPPKPPKKTKEKRIPPNPVWLNDTYLPYLDEALAFNIELFNEHTFSEAFNNKETFACDIEIYRNYFLIAFKSVETGRVCYFEFQDKKKINTEWLIWLLENFKQITFNGIKFDIPILKIMLAKQDTSIIKDAADSLIKYNVRPYELLKKFKTRKLNIDHIDLIEVAPLSASLKIYGGRVHCRRMQDLPFDPDTILTDKQIAIVRLYCINDLDNTILLYNKLRTEISIREDIGNRYNLDVRSKSDPQVAETVVTRELGIKNRNDYIGGVTKSAFKYRIPAFIKYKSELLNHVLDCVRNETYMVSQEGRVIVPESILNLDISIKGTRYQMGNGGLHSTEKTKIFKSDNNYTLIDRDVISYYPMIVIVLGLFPSQLGRTFLKVFTSYVYERINAKKSGDDKRANMLKIFINGIFGKFGSIFSIMYAPELLIQVTLTGQLALLMLIERLELAGIHVVSANTDGVVIRQPNHRCTELLQIIETWEVDTGFKTEETKYSALYSRDVNNYIAVYDKPVKGLYSKNKGFFRKADLSKNAVNSVCISAVEKFLTHSKPVYETIKECTDIREFLTIRTVKGGGVKIWSESNIDFLGKAIRWYYSTEVEGEIVYAKSGNKVPKSDTARPIMQLPDTFPTDINYDWYINESYDMLKSLGVNVNQEVL